jgi:hypothetical protein
LRFYTVRSYCIRGLKFDAFVPRDFRVPCSDQIPKKTSAVQCNGLEETAVIITNSCQNNGDLHFFYEEHFEYLLPSYVFINNASVKIERLAPSQ